mmetsp:Transcript_4980/g.19918  ORF Transcript_4980/g.19918 Transcript_4980/m.19918 type:complete len:359 (+) Transcript_4980:323-1399(+)
MAVLQGHQAPISALAVDPETQTIFTGRGRACGPGHCMDSPLPTARHLIPVCLSVCLAVCLLGSTDGVVCSWTSGVGKKVAGAIPRSITGSIHNGRVQGLARAAHGLVSIGWDDQIRVAPFAEGEELTFGAGIGKRPGLAHNRRDCSSASPNPVLRFCHAETTGQPASMCLVGGGSDVFALVTSETLSIFQGPELVCSVADLGFEPLCAAINPAGNTVAVGAKDDKIYVFAFDADAKSLTKTNALEGHRGEVSSLAFSPCGGFLAAGDAYKEVRVWKTEDWTPKIQGRWVFHTSRVTALCWSPNGVNLASGSSDTKVIIWNLKKSLKKKEINYAHMGGVTGALTFAGSPCAAHNFPFSF